MQTSDSSLIDFGLFSTTRFPSTSNMNDGSTRRIFFSLTEYFVCNWCGIAFTERNVSQQVRQRIPLAPAEINVRQLTGLVSQTKQESSYCVWYCGRFGTKYFVALDRDAADFERTRKL